MRLSAWVGLSSAIAHFDSGDQPVESGAGMPWGVEVTLTPKGSKPVVLVLDDGGLVTIDGGAARIRVDLPADPEPDEAREPRHGGDGGPEPGRKFGGGLFKRRYGRTESVRLTPDGARAIYISVPYGTERPRRMQLGALTLEMQSGTEMLATFNEKQELLGIAELSGERGLVVTVDGQARVCPADHVLDLRQPERPQRGAAAAASASKRFNLANIRRIHALESLRDLLDAAKDSPVAARLSDTLSHLRPETLRRAAPSISRLLEMLRSREAPRDDVILIARALRSADQAGLEVRLLVEKAIWAKVAGHTGSELGEHLDKFLDWLKREASRAGRGDGRKK